MHSKTIYGLAWIAMVCGWLSVLATAQDTAFTYQGRLNNKGLPADNSYAMSFSLFDSEVGGLQVGSTQVFSGMGGNPAPVAVVDGLFNVPLDFGAMPFADNASLWLEIAVEGTTLTPRQQLTATPHSLSTRGITVDADGNISGQHGTAIGNNAFIGLGGGQYPNFDRVHDLSHTTTDFSSSNLWSSVLSVFTIDPDVDLIAAELFGGSFELDTAETSDKDVTFVNGLFGGTFHRGTGTLVNSLGGFFYSGVEGSGNITHNFGVGVNSGAGFSGLGSITNNYGVSISTGHPSVSGGIDFNYGLYVREPDGPAPVMFGNYGIYVESQNTASLSGLTYAIYTEGGDVRFGDDLNVVGSIAKGGGSFKIDHPLDPENKFLYHSFVESPDMMNIYNGNVTTNNDGYATVEMPDWFEALNREFRYQLTVIDGANNDDFVLAKVVQEISGNQFKVRTSTGNTKLSWQVTGVRQDAWAEANRIPVEVNKNDQETGRYLHPQAFGKDVSQGIGESSIRKNESRVSIPMSKR